MPAQQAGHAAGEPLGGKAGRHGQHHGAVAAVAEPVAGVGDLRQRGLDALPVAERVLGRLHLADLAHEQGDAQPFLQLLDLL
ncbi:hypothetical protein RZS08_10515, partial [Arthrospira platensis SPKY1]|nr:hypothetical protein [Arthrospira platensis SPKY1]